MKNPFGKESLLLIKSKAINGKTYLENSYFSAPFKIAKPFYEDNGIMSIMVMSASAGIMEGDTYRIDVELDAESKVRLESQSYQKIHRMKEGCALQHNSFRLGKGSFLDYWPKAVIPFKDSRFRSTMECRMAEGSAFLYSEILSGGRVKSGEVFEFGEYRSSIRIYYGNELIFAENQFLCPMEQYLGGIGFFEGYTHLASLGFFYDKLDDSLIDDIYEELETMEGLQFGISKAKKFGLVVRILENRSDKLENILGCVKHIIYKNYYKKTS